MIKWEKTDKTTKEEELESSRCRSCGMRQEKAHHLNRCKNSSRRAVFERQIQVLEEWMSSSYILEDKGGVSSSPQTSQEA